MCGFSEGFLFYTDFTSEFFFILHAAGNIISVERNEKADRGSTDLNEHDEK